MCAKIGAVLFLADTRSGSSVSHVNVYTVLNKWTLYVKCTDFLSVLSKRPVNSKN